MNMRVLRAVVLIFFAAVTAGDESWLQASAKPSSDGSIFQEDFNGIDVGDIPVEWTRHIQVAGDRVQGIAEVSDRFAANRTFHLDDGQAHIAVWSVSDEVLPEDNRWAVQFDLYLTGWRYTASDSGAIFGLKEGARRRGNFLPVIQLENQEARGEVTLLGLGKVLESDISVLQWHRIVIRRDGLKWGFYLNGELKREVEGVESGLRGYAFGSFKDWHHVCRDVYIDNFKIGRFVK